MADGRGIAGGRELVARFGSLDRLVWFLRLLSAEAVPDEIWLGLRVRHVRSQVGARELTAVMPQPSTHAADLVARAARTAGGQCFTGVGRHFVQYRDPRAPFGYDATFLLQVEPADLVLYAHDGDLTYRAEGELSVERLVLGLELLRRPGMAAIGGTQVYVTARRGVAPTLIEHLHAAGVGAGAALCEPERGGFGDVAAFWLLRIDDPPRRLVPLLARTPGLALYTPVFDRALVAAGYRHPLHLEGCRALFPPDRLVLFGPAGPLVVAASPSFVALDDLVQLRVPSATDANPRTATTASPPVMPMELRLERASHRPLRARAAWIPWSQAGWFQRLCYALPASALRGHEVAFLEPGILVRAPDDLVGLPFGQALDEAAPGVFVPVGMRLVPALDGVRLMERLGLPLGGLLLFVDEHEPPFRIAPGQLESLDRQILSQLRIEPGRTPPAPREARPPVDAPPPEVVHAAWPILLGPR